MAVCRRMSTAGATSEVEACEPWLRIAVKQDGRAHSISPNPFNHSRVQPGQSNFSFRGRRPRLRRGKQKTPPRSGGLRESRGVLCQSAAQCSRRAPQSHEANRLYDARPLCKGPCFFCALVRGGFSLSYPVNFEQMPLLGGCKVTENCGHASKKPFVQTDFSVNKWWPQAAGHHEIFSY